MLQERSQDRCVPRMYILLQATTLFTGLLEADTRFRNKAQQFARVRCYGWAVGLSYVPGLEADRGWPVYSRKVHTESRSLACIRAPFGADCKSAALVQQ